MAGHTNWRFSLPGKVLTIICLLLASLPAAAAEDAPQRPVSDSFSLELPSFIKELPSTTRRYYSTKPVLAQFEVGGFVVSFSLILVDEPMQELLRSRDPLPREAWESVSSIGNPLLHLVLGLLSGLIGSEAGEDLFYACLYNDLNTAAIRTLTGMARPRANKGVVFRGITLDDDFAALPSCHTSSSFAAAGVMAEHYPEWKPVLYLTATAVGLSRVFLNEHWPSNVVLGALIGHLSARHYLQVKEELEP